MKESPNVSEAYEYLQPIAPGTLAKRGIAAYIAALVINLVLASVILQFMLVGSAEFLQYPPIVLWTTVGVLGRRSYTASSRVARRRPTRRSFGSR